MIETQKNAVRAEQGSFNPPSMGFRPAGIPAMGERGSFVPPSSKKMAANMQAERGQFMKGAAPQKRGKL